MKSAESFHDSIADEFDELMDHYDLERRIEVVFETLLEGKDLRGRTVLDAGCGTGAFSAQARARGARVVALDIGPALLRLARAKAKTDVVCASVLTLPFGDGVFDLVISSECIEHTPDPRRAVKELIRVLRPGGLVALTCPNRFWLWSCRLANSLGLRPYRGLENWPSWSEIEDWLSQPPATLEAHFGLHMFPFVVPASHSLLRSLDRWGHRLGRGFVNQCARARRLEEDPKPSPEG